MAKQIPAPEGKNIPVKENIAEKGERIRLENRLKFDETWNKRLNAEKQMEEEQKRLKKSKLKTTFKKIGGRLSSSMTKTLRKTPPKINVRPIQYSSPQSRKAMSARMQALRNRKTAIRKKLNAPASSAVVQYPNKFAQRLQYRKNLYAMQEAKRRYKEVPRGYAAMVNDTHDAERAQRRAFAARNNITKAHEMMDTRSMNFLQTEGSILTTPNMFSSSNPLKMDIMRTGRPTLLSPSEDNILRAKHKLRFGKE